MRKIALRKPSKRTVIAVSAALVAFLIIYLGGAINDASRRYARAASISKAHAHTNVGREGYEYIFEPNTQIFIDKILPYRTTIIAIIVAQDYLSIELDSGCGLVDVDICTWLRFDVFYGHDQTALVIRLLLYASITAILTGAGFSLLYRPSQNALNSPHHERPHPL